MHLDFIVLLVKNLPASAGDIRDLGSIPGSKRSPGGGHDNQPWYSCLENLLDRGAWRATVQSVAKSWTRLRRISTHNTNLWSEFFVFICLQNANKYHQTTHRAS